MVILKFDTVPLFLHAVRYFVGQKVFSSKHLSTFLPRKYDVISQLRHSYAKGPFCVVRLIWLWRFKTFVNISEGPVLVWVMENCGYIKPKLRILPFLLLQLLQPLNLSRSQTDWSTPQMDWYWEGAGGSTPSYLPETKSHSMSQA